MPRIQIRKRAFKVLLTFFLVISVVGIAKVISDRVVFFPLMKVEIIGNKHLSKKEVSTIARLRKGVSIFSVPSGSVVKRLERSPWVKDVSLRKELPDKIVIKIKESVPSALLQEDKELYLLSSNGTVLEKQAEGEKFLPVIKGDTGNKRALYEAIKLARILNQNGFDKEIHSEILVSDIENMRLKYGDTMIKIGYADYEDKLKRYFEIKDEIVRRSIPIEYVDLRYAKRVIVKTPVGSVN